MSLWKEAMPFAYYDRLGAERQRTYRRSDAIRRIDIPDARPLVELARAIAPLPESGDRAAVETACEALVAAIKLAETFHTEGFYARESALVRELLAEALT